MTSGLWTDRPITRFYRIYVEFKDKEGCFRKIKNTKVYIQLSNQLFDITNRYGNINLSHMTIIYNKILISMFNLLYPLKNNPKEFIKVCNLFNYAMFEIDYDRKFWGNVDPYHDLPRIVCMLENRKEEKDITTNKIALRRKQSLARLGME